MSTAELPLERARSGIRWVLHVMDTMLKAEAIQSFEVESFKRARHDLQRALLDLEDLPVLKREDAAVLAFLKRRVHTALQNGDTRVFLHLDHTYPGQLQWEDPMQALRHVAAHEPLDPGAKLNEAPNAPYVDPEEQLRRERIGMCTYCYAELPADGDGVARNSARQEFCCQEHMGKYHRGVIL